ncbi:hypothetical protein HMPREF1624_02908 [Sporothrix schenckii ATCC 58251]|uniref:Uncharacterized protein n=1 Tax=Sporothrix schenckii (strain ATCC 58251 / de Perez 2211183) TaxID=1391915 RepID=U7Q4L5_SPOS1|nr:hypothetical protein HMPREF1624_02908 [Sporothrix schenckii ATCC 58251]
MASVPQSFYCLWQEERICETLFDMLPKEDVCSVRLANSACCNLVTKRLFMRTHLAFTANTFTKASRVQALSRIGHHVEHLTFYLEHSEATFLPPLIHPLTGREISFLYTPHTCMASVLTRPKYTNSELGDVLTQQYPPLFHAATNVPSFLNAMQHMPNIRHLTIKCPGQDPKERYRRSIVDYALISLRISIERAPLHKLCKLSLSGVHPAAFNYLRHVSGFGSHPSAARRWRQIRKLYVSVDAWDFYGSSPGLDHLKIMDDFIRHMAPNLEKFSFTWLGNKGCSSGSGVRKGPCPIALSGDSLFSPRPEGPKKLFNEVTGPMSPLPPAPRREPMHFPHLRCLTIRNAAMNTPQLRDLVDRHNQNVREFDFENVSLVDGGSYEEAFSRLLDEKGSGGLKLWSRTRKGDSKPQSSDAAADGEVAAQGSSSSSSSSSSPPINGAGQGSPSGHQSFRFAAASYTGSLSSASSTVLCGPSAVAAPDDVELSSPSAAVAAVSRELLDLEVEDLENYLGLGSELPFMLDSPSDVSVSDETQPYMRAPPPPPIEELDEELDSPLLEDERIEDDGEVVDEDGGLASDIAAAHEASLTFTTRFKKRRIRRSHRRHHSDGYSKDSEERRSRSHRHHDGHTHSHHRHHLDQNDNKSHPRKKEDQRREASRSHSRSHSSHGRRRKGRKDKESPSSSGSGSGSPSTPPPPALPAALAVLHHPFAHRTLPPQPPQPRPAIVGQDTTAGIDDDVFRPRTAPDSPLMAPLNISAPILVPSPHPVVLQPTVYDPSATVTATAIAAATASGLSRTTSSSSSSSARGRQGSAGPVEDDGLSAIQRQILQEEKQAQMNQTEKRQMMADDADARTSALKKAKEAVLAKLSREFNRRIGRETAQLSAAASAATMAAAAASVSMGMPTNNHGIPQSGGSTSTSTSTSQDNHYHHHHHHNAAATATLSLLAGLRLRERLFGTESMTASAAPHLALPSVAMDQYQHRSMESNSAVVPLIFSRA